MRYQESATESAELLRLILPRIARHGGAYVPTTYSLWYEYLSGVNPKLIAALDERLRNERPMTQAEVEHFYSKFIDTREASTLEAYQAGLSELMRRLAEIAASSGAGTAEFSRTLAQCQHDLGAISDPAGVHRIIQSLVTSTTAVRESTTTLQKEVAATREEMQQLRGQMGELQNLAQTDPLTRLRNRRGFELAVSEFALGRAADLGGCSLLIADIDQFKKVNDNYGHLVGDQVIRALAQVLQNSVKGRDITARWGGEEFIVLLPQTPGEGAVTLAEQVRVAFGKTRIKSGGRKELSDTVTISIGVAEIASGEPLEQAVGRADSALYTAKNGGRNCVRVAPPAGATDALEPGRQDATVAAAS
ncbi:MAG: GGDEF domain-containing protein [Gammaproteobacteria bacterium]|nr:GGDEF domain-containing protein [Gammaproteobacteria bacterium]MDE2249783.1 GGDEF domain-containing protein [Gammaproteobacteria bacterium]